MGGSVRTHYAAKVANLASKMLGGSGPALKQQVLTGKPEAYRTVLQQSCAGRAVAREPATCEYAIDMRALRMRGAALWSALTRQRFRKRRLVAAIQKVPLEH